VPRESLSVQPHNDRRRCCRGQEAVLSLSRSRSLSNAASTLTHSLLQTVGVAPSTRRLRQDDDAGSPAMALLCSSCCSAPN
jgi:hypothetical protein